MSITPIHALGATLEDQWRAAGRDPLAFPDLAVEALAEASLVEKVSFRTLVDWAMSCPRSAFPLQADPHATFGDPPITLWRGTQFHIDLLIWVDSVPSLHDHSFTGAFQVLAGGSMHHVTRFHTETTWSASLKTGRLETVQRAFLRPGDICAIPPHEAFIHSLLHTGRPSATIVVRTDEHPARAPQMVYLPPGIAIAGQAPQLLTDGMYQRRRQLLVMMMRTGDDRLGAALGQMLEEADPLQALDLLRVTFPHVCQNVGVRGGLQRLRGILAALEARYPGLTMPLRASLAEGERRRRLIAIRRQRTDQALRDLLAVLVVSETRQDVLALLQAPEVVAQLETLATAGDIRPEQVALVRSALTGEPSGLGLPEVALSLLLQREKAGLLGPLFRTEDVSETIRTAPERVFD